MNTHTDKTQENKSQSIASDLAQVQSSGDSTFQFVDNRPEALAQRKQQEMANSSPLVMKLKAFQEMPNNSPQYKQATQLQVMAGNHTIQQQPIHKKENSTGLPDNLKTEIESLSGYSLDDVKVNYSSDKPAQLHAYAYAQGADIHIASGQERQLPHEAWHGVQQKQGRVRPTLQLRISDENTAIQRTISYQVAQSAEAKWAELQKRPDFNLLRNNKIFKGLDASKMSILVYVGENIKGGSEMIPKNTSHKSNYDNVKHEIGLVEDVDYIIKLDLNDENSFPSRREEWMLSSTENTEDHPKRRTSGHLLHEMGHVQQWVEILERRAPEYFNRTMPYLEVIPQTLNTYNELEKRLDDWDNLNKILIETMSGISLNDFLEMFPDRESDTGAKDAAAESSQSKLDVSGYKDDKSDFLLKKSQLQRTWSGTMSDEDDIGIEGFIFKIIENDNVLRHETPFAKEIGDPIRMQYDVGEKKTDNDKEKISRDRIPPYNEEAHARAIIAEIESLEAKIHTIKRIVDELKELGEDIMKYKPSFDKLKEVAESNGFL